MLRWPGPQRGLRALDTKLATSVSPVNGLATNPHSILACGVRPSVAGPPLVALQHVARDAVLRADQSRTMRDELVPLDTSRVPATATLHALDVWMAGPDLDLDDLRRVFRCNQGAHRSPTRARVRSRTTFRPAAPGALQGGGWDRRARAGDRCGGRTRDWNAAVACGSGSPW